VFRLQPLAHKLGQRHVVFRYQNSHKPSLIQQSDSS
jgi:hypothetical protein